MNQANRFLTALFGDAPPDAHVLLWTLPDRRSRFLPVAALASAAASAAELAATRDVYVGCGLRARDHGAVERGGGTDVVSTPGAWADLDCAKPGATKSYFPSRATLMAFLDALPLRPTLWVWSGGGVHAWWLFREPWLFTEAADRERATRLLAAWQAYLRERAHTHGATLDATHDLARVLRVPGTMNHKHGVPVVLEVTDGPRCNPSDLEDLAGEVPLATPGGTVVPALRLVAGPLCLDAQAEPPARKLAVLLVNNPKFARSWDHERPDLADQSASAYDQSLATLAVEAGWSDQEVVDLLIAHRRRHRSRPKLRADYYRRTLATARAALARQAADSAFEAAVLDGRVVA